MLRRNARPARLATIAFAIVVLLSCVYSGAFATKERLRPAAESTGVTTMDQAGEDVPQGNTDCSWFGIPELSPLANRQPVHNDDGSTVPGVELRKTFVSADIEGEYNIYARGIDRSKPVGLVVRLHGDGATDFDDPDDMSACLAEVAAAHNMITVVPKTPDPSDDLTWWENIPPNMAWVGALINEEIIPAYGIDPQLVEWMGYSGGSEMLTYGVLAAHPEWVTLGALMLGGGGAPMTVLSRASDDQLQHLPLTWMTGLEDRGADNDFDALAKAQNGVDFYEYLGFENITRMWLPDVDHGNLPHAQALEAELARVLDERQSRARAGTAETSIIPATQGQDEPVFEPKGVEL